MDAFELSQIAEERQASGEPFREFIRSSTLSVGLYGLPAGAVDPQTPHTEDEIYFVVGGRGTLRVGDEDRPIEPGMVVFVAAGVDHRFHSITEDLSVLVVFAPPRGSRA